MTSISAKTPDYSPWFLARKRKFLTLVKNDFKGKGVSRGAEWHNFSSVAPSNAANICMFMCTRTLTTADTVTSTAKLVR